ncbi:unnamed protein product, partial [Meganyctiphanes norvegica]
HYRAHKVALWNWLIPELQAAGAVYPDEESQPWTQTDNNEHFIGPVRPLDPYRFLQTTKEPSTTPLPVLPSPRDEYWAPNVSAAQGSINRNVNDTLVNGGVMA